MTVCGADMGGIWIPHRSGASDYKLIRCTRSVGHSFDHAFEDPKSNMIIMSAGEPTLTVDHRGCVTGPPHEDTR